MRSCTLLTVLVASSWKAVQAYSSNSSPAFLPRVSSEENKHVIPLDDASFDELLMGHDKLVLVDAYSQNCGPCILMEPVLERCAQERSDSLVVAKYDVHGKNIKCKFELALQKVTPRKLPSLILFHKGKVINHFEGMLLDRELNDFLDANVQ